MSQKLSTLIEETKGKLGTLKSQEKKLIETLVEELESLIKNTSHINELAWSQHTPYFNDGLECRFEIHDLRVTLTQEAADLLNTNNVKPHWYAKTDREYKWEADSEYGESLSSLRGAIERHIEVVEFEELSELGSLIDSITTITDFLSENIDSLKVAFGDHTDMKLTKTGLEVTSNTSHD